jgi:predicted small lipoprotein YifL
MKHFRNLVLIPCLALLFVVALTACGGKKGYLPASNPSHVQQAADVPHMTWTRREAFALLPSSAA